MKGPNLIQHIWLAGVLSLLAIAFFMASPLPAQAISCGDTITKDTKLTTNLTHCTSTGITIGANNITLDCKGHTITGTNEQSSAGINISSQTGVIIKNCKVTGFASGFFGNSNGLLIKNEANLNVVGFDFLGDNNILQNNAANNNNGEGIFISGNNNLLQGNTLNNNDGRGITVGGVSSNNTITGNTVSNNGLDGIFLAGQPGEPTEGNVLSSNTVSNNGLAGILVEGSSDNTIINNTASNNFIGFEIIAFDGISPFPSSNNTLIKNKAFSNGADFTQDNLGTNNICIKNNFSCN